LLLIERYYRERPNGFVISSGVALWGLARFVEEHFWLGLGAQAGTTQSESHAGPILVQGAGLLMFGAGVALMALSWWRARGRAGLTAPGEAAPGTAPEADGERASPDRVSG